MVHFPYGNTAYVNRTFTIRVSVPFKQKNHLLIFKVLTSFSNVLSRCSNNMTRSSRLSTSSLAFCAHKNDNHPTYITSHNSIDVIQLYIPFPGSPWEAPHAAYKTFGVLYTKVICKGMPYGHELKKIRGGKQNDDNCND